MLGYNYEKREALVPRVSQSEFSEDLRISLLSVSSSDRGIEGARVPLLFLDIVWGMMAEGGGSAPGGGYVPVPTFAAKEGDLSPPRPGGPPPVDPVRDETGEEDDAGGARPPPGCLGVLAAPVCSVSLAALGVAMLIAAQEMERSRGADASGAPSASSASSAAGASDSSSSAAASASSSFSPSALGGLSLFGGGLFIFGLLMWWLVSPPSSAYPYFAYKRLSPRDAAGAAGAARPYLQFAATLTVVVAFACVEAWSLSLTVQASREGAPVYIFQPTAKPDRTLSTALLATGTLDNGLRYTVLPGRLEATRLARGPPFDNADATTAAPPPPPSAPGTLSLAVHVQAGSYDEGPERERGLAHFVEHLAFDSAQGEIAIPGSPTPLRLDRRYGVWSALDRLGVSSNAYTTARATVYEMNGFRNDTATVKAVLGVVRRQLFQLRTNQQNMDLEKGAVLGENRMRNGTSSIFEQRVACAAFGAQAPPCARDPIGLVDTVAAFTKTDADGFLQKWYHPSRMTIYVAGDITRGAIEPLLKEILSGASDEAAGRAAPADHPNPERGGLAGVYGGGRTEKETSADPARAKARDPAFTADRHTLQLHDDLLGFDGVEFTLRAADPNEGSYRPPPFDLDQRLRHVHETLFAYVYPHMVLSAAVARYEGEVDKGLPDLDCSSNLVDSYQYAARYHSLNLRVGSGHGGELGASEVKADAWTGQWRTELHAALAELRRLAEHGPAPELLERAMSDYHASRMSKTDAFYAKPSHELVMDLYGELDGGPWLAPIQIERDEAAMVHPSMTQAAANAVQAEAAFLWATISRIAGVELPQEPAAYHEGVRAAPRSLLTVASAPVGASRRSLSPHLALSQQSIRAVVRAVSKMTLEPPSGENLGSVKSDHMLMDKTEDEDEWTTKLQHRRYVRRHDASATIQGRPRTNQKAIGLVAMEVAERRRLHAAAKEAAGQQTLRRASSVSLLKGQRTPQKQATKKQHAAPPIKSPFPTPVSGSGGSAGDSSSSATDTSLLDFPRLYERLDMMFSVAQEADAPAAQSVSRLGARLVEDDSDNSGVVRYELLNGIGVNVKPIASGKASLPAGPPGELRLEIVSLGGAATLPAILAGGCEVVNGAAAPEFSGVQYFHRGLPEEDEDEFSADEVSAARDASGVTSTAWMDLERLVAASGAGGAADAVTLPGPPGSNGGDPSLTCEPEHTVISATLLGPCPKLDGSCRPGLVTRSVFMPTLAAARLAMRPYYTTRTVRKAYSTAVDTESARGRDRDPESVSDRHAVDDLLDTFVGRQDADHRLARVTPPMIAKLDSVLLSAWAREQFLPDRTEINVVGDVPDTKDLLVALQIVFGTLPRYNASAEAGRAYPRLPPAAGREKTSTTGDKVSLDPFEPGDAPHFVRTWSRAPNASALRKACYVRNVNARRALVGVAVPSFDALAPRGTVMGRVARAMAKRLMWSKVRKEQGLSYYVNVNSFHSTLFAGFGWHHVTWGAGQHRVRDPAADPLNVDFSVSVVDGAFSAPPATAYTQDLFDDAKAEMLADARSHLETDGAGDWLMVLRGMSLRVPAAMAAAQGTVAAPGDVPLLKEVSEANVLAQMEEVTRDAFLGWVGTHGPKSGVAGRMAMSHVLETCDAGVAVRPLYAAEEAECD